LPDFVSPAFVRIQLFEVLMEQLDEMAISIGQSSCLYLGDKGHDSLQQLLCSDGNYSAGWKLIAAALVIIGLVFAWLGLGRKYR